jgi:arabinofuranan 3-O-arabinosyltransferase
VGATVRFRFASMRTSHLALTFTTSAVPLQIADVQIPGVRQLHAGGSGQLRLRCGSGPRIWMDGRVVPTRVSGTVADLLDERPLTFSACAPVTMAAGWNSVVEPVTDSWDVQTAVLNRSGSGLASAGPAGAGGSVSVVAWTAAKRVLRVVAPGRSYLVVHQNFNQGWQATARGTVLRAVRLDGWEQAWLLPAGTTGTVTLSYLPDALYRDNVFGGLGALVVVLLVAAIPVRRRRAPRPAAQAAVPGSAALPGLSRLRLRVGPKVAVAGIGVASCVGFWIGGYPGALLLPVTAGFFAAAIALSGTSRTWRVVASPPVAAGVLVTAAMAQALGGHLIQAGDAGQVISWIADTGPQLLSVVVAGRLAASLIVPEGPVLPAVPAGHRWLDEPVQALRRAFDHVVADRGDSDRQRRDHDQEADRVQRAERAAVEDIPKMPGVEERVYHEELPEEDPV